MIIPLKMLQYSSWRKHDGNMPQNAEKSYSHTVFFNSPNGETTLGYNLKVQNVQPLDEGWYCCVAANEAGSTTDSGWLEINSYCQAHGYPMAHNSNMQSYSLLIKYYT